MTPKKKFVCEVGRRYWMTNAGKIAELPTPCIDPAEIIGRTEFVELPDWATDIGVGEPAALLVLSEFLIEGEGASFERCDWFGVVYTFLNGEVERQAERNGHISHAYTSRIDIAPVFFDRAWVNRIFLFLRRWAAHIAQAEEVALLGPMPRTEIWLTHDVDAVAKTPAIRMKQVAMHILGSMRCLGAGRVREATCKVWQALRFLFVTRDYWQFPEIRRIEVKSGIRSAFFVYGGQSGQKWNFKKWLIDPSYSVSEGKLRRELISLHAEGWEIGLHPSFSSWQDATAIAEERRVISTAIDDNVVICRQHWFRFSWTKTWQAQHAAGVKVDATLGMNDRPGFRNGGALAFRPVDPTTGRDIGVVAVPTILMDSHLYDYKEMTEEERHHEILHWIGEVVSVHGQATVLWHQRVMSEDYGWKSGFEYLVDCIRPYISLRSLGSLSERTDDVT